MKKTTLISSIAFAFIMLLSFNALAQKFPKLDKSPLDASIYRAEKNGPALIKVIYSRPFLKGRSLSQLAPNGKVWRTGANEAAEITLYKDMKIGGKKVKAGTYSLFTIPGDKEWIIILSSDLNVWGAYSYKEAHDVVRVNAPVTSGDESVENFSIKFKKTANGTDMYMGWGTLRVAVPFTK
ncbi:DUF2911 domain-containing protein [Tamlana sp. 2201CG12-4]|uniref:DUF2911 domain-containing protein n=1 Tax=Tamlana sp. 2201CG12-4 TaxID=3112582 RepID=UPI002DB96E95|nr:DUF2911 domain-containing protein [Tamlana sp. 2201CG12-4]MEC3906970.1 DUF2911 domain-containing protein [Tamlana sp. 2201CG12-4]